jgi:hypothetical protein
MTTMLVLGLGTALTGVARAGTQWTAISTFPDKEGCANQATIDRMHEGGEFRCISNAGPATHGENSWTLYQKYTS